MKTSSKRAQPQGFSRREVERLLSKTRREGSAGGRIDLLSRNFLGRPYRANPLTGSAEKAEVFTASLDGFDCVTYVETIVALACASNADDFVRWLRKLRYEGGRLQWAKRNHYMTQWIRNNEREGIIKPLSTPGVPVAGRERVLNTVAGLAPRRAVVKCVPKRAMARVRPHLQSGDLIFFVSTHRNLDVFHCGIIVRDGKTFLMRHASRTRGCVVEEKLSEFLKTNRMTGVIVVRLRACAGRKTR